jgi:hypothetical protein
VMHTGEQGEGTVGVAAETGVIIGVGLEEGGGGGEGSHLTDLYYGPVWLFS